MELIYFWNHLAVLFLALLLDTFQSKAGPSVGHWNACLVKDTRDVMGIFQQVLSPLSFVSMLVQVGCAQKYQKYD